MIRPQSSARTTFSHANHSQLVATMAGTMKLSSFPDLLLDMVIEYLDKEDLLRCCLVCSRLNRIATTYLYRNIHNLTRLLSLRLGLRGTPPLELYQNLPLIPPPPPAFDFPGPLPPHPGVAVIEQPNADPIQAFQNIPFPLPVSLSFSPPKLASVVTYVIASSGT